MNNIEIGIALLIFILLGSAIMIQTIRNVTMLEERDSLKDQEKLMQETQESVQKLRQRQEALESIITRPDGLLSTYLTDQARYNGTMCIMRDALMRTPCVLNEIEIRCLEEHLGARG